MFLDKKKYLKRINNSNKLVKKCTFLFKNDQDKSENENEKFMKCAFFLSDYTFWQSRREYLKIIKLFLDKNITVSEFINKFGRLRKLNLDVSETRKKNLENEALGGLPKLSEINFYLNPQCIGFTHIISSLYNYMDLFDPNIDFEMDLESNESFAYSISEEVLRLSIKNNFLPIIIQYCKQSKIDYNIE